jgi:hypothetical protein
MPRNPYIAVFFQARPHAFANDNQLAERIQSWTGKDDFTIKRENYADDRWSGWFSLVPRHSDVVELGRMMEKMPGLGAVMLRTLAGQVVQLPKVGPKPAAPAPQHHRNKPPRL